MVAIKNLEKKELVISFEGLDYYFPKDTIVLIEPKLFEHLKEIFPLSFDYQVELPKKGQVTKVKTTKTRSYLGVQKEQMQDMKVTRSGEQDNTFADFDTQGPEFYGAGIEKDTV